MASIGLNPSTADEFRNDPTICRECERAAQLGKGSLLKLNLFPFKAKNPREMLRAKDPFGEWIEVEPMIDAIFAHYAEGLVCATWGNYGTHRGRADAFRREAARQGLRLWAYEVNQTGEPAHPLYLPYSLKPQPYLGNQAVPAVTPQIQL